MAIATQLAVGVCLTGATGLAWGISSLNTTSYVQYTLSFSYSILHIEVYLYISVTIYGC